jgi:protoheme IX farnesyltransferase
MLLRLAVPLQVTSPWFAGEAAVLAAAMGVGALSFRASPTAAGARKLFRGSLLYLPLLLAGLAIHRQPNTHAVTWQTVRDEAGVQLSSISALLPEQLQPGQVWEKLQQLHWPELRPVEERYAMLFEMQQQLQNIKCPSRAYGDTLEEEGVAATAAALAAAATEAAAVSRQQRRSGSSSSDSSGSSTGL